MKKFLFVILAISFLVNLHAQTEDGSLIVELRHRDYSYTLDKRKNDFYSEDRRGFCGYPDGFLSLEKKDNGELIVEEGFGGPRFYESRLMYNSNSPMEFCKILASVIYDNLSDSMVYDFDLIIDFEVCQDGLAQNVESHKFCLDSTMTYLEAPIIKMFKESVWNPERHYWKVYTSPMELHISAKDFIKGKNIAVINYSDDYYEDLCNKLFLTSPYYEKQYGIPEYQIASDDELDTKAHLEDCSITLNQWIKTNIQDAVKISGFENSETTIELIISAKGWDQKASVITTDNELLGEHLRYEILNSPKWTPATINGENVPSKVIFNYSWRF